jgi:hypothetical protein
MPESIRKLEKEQSLSPALAFSPKVFRKYEAEQ